MIHLPPELYEAIVDHLDGDNDALRQCALVSHLFARRCQQLLFRSITLGRPSRQFRGNIVSKNWPSQKLFKILVGAPHLSQLVQELEVSDATLMNFYREELSWIRRDSDVARILPLLDNLRSLVIAGNHLGSRMNFRAWKRELKFSILRKTPSITTVSLAYVRNVPWMIFKSVPSLRSLYLHQVSFVPNDVTVLPIDSQLDAQSDQARLETLHIKTTSKEEWRSFYLWLQIDGGSFNLDHITDLSLDVDVMVQESQVNISEELQGIAWLVRRCSSSLQSLDLFFPEEVASSQISPHNFIELDSMPFLKQLCLHGCVWSDRSLTGYQSTLRWVVRNLSILPESLQLRRLTLLLTIDDFLSAPEVGLEQAGWEDLSMVAEKLASRSEVCIHVSILGRHGLYVENVLRERLSRLLSLKVLTINCVGSEVYVN